MRNYIALFVGCFVVGVLSACMLQESKGSDLLRLPQGSSMADPALFPESAVDGAMHLHELDFSTDDFEMLPRDCGCNGAEPLKLHDAGASGAGALHADHDLSVCAEFREPGDTVDFPERGWQLAADCARGFAVTGTIDSGLISNSSLFGTNYYEINEIPFCLEDRAGEPGHCRVGGLSAREGAGRGESKHRADADRSDQLRLALDHSQRGIPFPQ